MKYFILHYIFFFTNPSSAGRIMKLVNRQAAIPKNRMAPIPAIAGYFPIKPRDPNPIMVVAAERKTPFPVNR
jgi:hypothetical protein